MDNAIKEDNKFDIHYILEKLYAEAVVLIGGHKEKYTHHGPALTEQTHQVLCTTFLSKQTTN